MNVPIKTCMIRTSTGEVPVADCHRDRVHAHTGFSPVMLRGTFSTRNNKVNKLEQDLTGLSQTAP